MGWLQDLNKNRVYNYRSEDDPEVVVSGTREELNSLAEGEVKCEPGDEVKIRWENEEGTIGGVSLFKYAGFEPVEVGLTTKVVFEKNGRKGIRVKDGKGKTTTRSMTRENLMKGKGVSVTGDKLDHKGNRTGKKSYEVNSVLTKACAEHSGKIQAKMVRERLTGMKKNIERQAHLAKERKKGRK